MCVAKSFHVDDLPCEELEFDIHLMVQNVGGRKGEQVVMAFWKPPSELVHQGAPIKQLVGFQRIHGLRPQEATRIKMRFNVCEHFSHVSREGERFVRAGFHNLSIGQREHAIEFQLEKQTTMRGMKKYAGMQEKLTLDNM
jgi:beta-D-xylosidase 4